MFTYPQIQCRNQNLAQRPASCLTSASLVNSQFSRILKKKYKIKCQNPLLQQIIDTFKYNMTLYYNILVWPFVVCTKQAKNIFLLNIRYSPMPEALLIIILDNCTQQGCSRQETLIQRNVHVENLNIQKLSLASYCNINFSCTIQYIWAFVLPCVALLILFLTVYMWNVCMYLNSHL